MAIRWRGKLSIDGGPLDADHRHLLAIVNRFDADCAAEGNRPALQRALSDLRQFARRHFVREERLMREAGYPPERVREHENAHRTLIARLGTLVRHYETSAGDDDLAEVVWETADLLKHWLADHLVRFDLPLKPYLKRSARLSAPRATAARFWAARA
ncbi:hemerythrin family protein [Azospirillum sp. TSO22-1]|uniref:bacteriohemerythrin n=1 Tax=Azospirillum sp. TSO22-1 TaxID=716789 RepID=UPI001304C741|nr:hemerythrin family protein [Azospirillum sp. TSO22-1]